jgi:protein associated with RNAse G/E
LIIALDDCVSIPYDVVTEGRSHMQRNFLVESRSYDSLLRGSWRAYKLNETMRLGDEQLSPDTDGLIRLWLPAGTLMQWATGTRPLRNNCVMFFWPERWYMLSAFYNETQLIHTYASIIQPARIQPDRLSYVDLDLSVLVKPDLSFEVLTQAEFEQAANQLHYSEETRISSLMALRTLTSSIQRSIGLFSVVPLKLVSILNRA